MDLFQINENVCQWTSGSAIFYQPSIAGELYRLADRSGVMGCQAGYGNRKNGQGCDAEGPDYRGRFVL